MARLTNLTYLANQIQEKEALRAQMAADREEELAAVETTWKATLHDVEERAQREKDDIQVGWCEKVPKSASP